MPRWRAHSRSCASSDDARPDPALILQRIASRVVLALVAIVAWATVVSAEKVPTAPEVLKAPPGTRPLADTPFQVRRHWQVAVLTFPQSPVMGLLEDLHLFLIGIGARQRALVWDHLARPRCVQAVFEPLQELTARHGVQCDAFAFPGLIRVVPQ